MDVCTDEEPSDALKIAAEGIKDAWKNIILEIQSHYRNYFTDGKRNTKKKSPFPSHHKFTHIMLSMTNFGLNS